MEESNVSDVAIVGAGPYGLSIAAHLRGSGLDVRIFGDTMASWRHHMPVGMYLKSTPDASSLSAPTPGSSIFDYCDLIGSRALTEEDAIPMQLFIDYGMWFAEQHVPDVEDERVVAVERAGRDFDLTLGSGEVVRVHTVVVATGVIPYAYTPPELLAIAPDGPTPSGLVSHTSQHPDLSVFDGRSVAIVGAGQSALESAALMAEAGAKVQVLARGPQVLWGDVPDGHFDTPMYRFLKPPSALGYGWSARSMSGAPQMVRHLPAKARLALVKNVLGPSGAWWLRSRVEGHVDIHVDVAVRSAVALPSGGVRLATATRTNGADSIEVDHVLAATGYRVGLESLGFLGEDVRRSCRKVAGAPLLDASFETSVPGLYFSGISAAPTFGPLMRFVHGADYAARRIGASLPARGRAVAV
jgi:thioredoxin reductase